MKVTPADCEDPSAEDADIRKAALPVDDEYLKPTDVLQAAPNDDEREKPTDSPQEIPGLHDDLQERHVQSSKRVQSKHSSDSRNGSGNETIPRRQSGLFQFANAEAIKEKVRNAKTNKPAYNVHDKYHATGFFQWLARHPTFDNLTLGIIVVNALWISIDTDGNKSDTMLTAKVHFIVADVLFFAYFSFELGTRFMAFKRKKDCCRDAWFVFDTTLVALYAFDPFTIGLIALLSGGGGLNLPTAVLRLFRLARLSRLIRMLRNLPELMVMIKGMITASASVGYTLGLLFIITYVFAIALVNLAAPYPDLAELYFPDVVSAMHNLIIFGTFLDSLSNFIFDIQRYSYFCLFMAWIYIALASLTVMNMLIGVLCEVISAVAEEEKESMIVDKVHEKFGDIVRQLDENNDGTISWDEFQKILEYPDAIRALESVNVDPDAMIDMAEEWFFDDGEPIEVTFDDFMGMLLELRGGQTATVKDIMVMGKRFNQKLNALSKKIDAIADVLQLPVGSPRSPASPLNGKTPKGSALNAETKDAF